VCVGRAIHQCRNSREFAHLLQFFEIPAMRLDAGPLFDEDDVIGCLGIDENINAFAVGIGALF